MPKVKKSFKLLSIVLVLSMFVMQFSIVAFASGEPRITLSSTTCKSGDSVEIEVSLSNNPGFVNMRLTLTYDKEYLSLSGVEDKGVLGKFNGAPDYTVYPYVLVWENDTEPSNFMTNGAITVLKFKVADNAPDGTYNVSVSYDNENAEILDFDANTVDFAITNGSVQVKNTTTHTHNYKAVITKPNCTEKGYTTYTCEECGDSYVGDEVEALGHSFTKYVENGDGTKTAKCDRCDKTDTIASTSEIVVTSYDTVNATVPAGYIPTLPSTVTAHYSNGTSNEVNVVWATLGRNSFMTPGKVVEIKGATFEDSALMPNLDNSVVPTAYITVTKPLVLSINKAEAQTVVGTAPVLPETVTVKLSNDATAQAKVTWEAISPESYAQVGQFTVDGAIDAEGKDYEYVGEYAGLATVCTVKVTEKSSEQSQDKPSDNDKGEVIENVQTGEGSTALPMLALIASTFVMAYTLVINKFRRLRENI